MPRNGSGTYSLPVGNPVVTGTTISSTWANNTLTDISNALTGSLSADGQTTASGNLNMGTNRIINVGDPSNAQDAATKYYVDQLIAGLGTIAYQNANNVTITGGSISSVNLDLHSMTNEIYLPVGPTSLRTASPINGLMRFNSDAGGFYEGYINGNWQRFQTVNEGSYSITYLVVAGGGASAGSSAGGGGGGGVQTGSFTAIPATSFTLTIGAGGAAGSVGANSFIAGIITANGGGIGGSGSVGTTGGSGGGGGGSFEGHPAGFAGGSGISGQGYGGGTGSGTEAAVNGAGGGGGGAGGAGSNGGPVSGETSTGGAGGPGASSTLTGTTLYYAGGGGGGPGNGTGGAGGSGGGGAGGTGTRGAPGNGYSGTVNTGGGGGGGSWNGTGGSGGSGVILMLMPTANYSGVTTGSPVVSTVGSNTILKYTSSGTYTA